MTYLEKSRPDANASNPGPNPVEVGLNAAIVSINGDVPQLLIVPSSPTDAHGRLDMLPSGAFNPRQHRSLELALRHWVKVQSGLELGYLEQLYTFGDRLRPQRPGESSSHLLSIGYLALSRATDPHPPAGGAWRNWYAHLPWEDWREGRPAILVGEIEPRLRQWASRASDGSASELPVDRLQRIRICFGLDGGSWDEEKVLERYELLYEAGLLAESSAESRATGTSSEPLPRIGLPLRADHRRVLATAIGRLRAKIKYRPLVFELMSSEFTLFELQRTVEAILGSHLHKQNFRRLVETAGLVDKTGDVRTHTGGRPAKLYRFRREVLIERPAPGVRVKSGWAA